MQNPNAYRIPLGCTTSANAYRFAYARKGPNLMTKKSLSTRAKNVAARKEREALRQFHKKQSTALRRYMVALTFFLPSLDLVGGYIGMSRKSVQKVLDGKYVMKDELPTGALLAAMKKVAALEKDADRRRVMDAIILAFDKKHLPAHQRRVDLPTTLARYLNENETAPKANVIRFFTDQGVGAPQVHMAWRRLQDRIDILPELMLRWRQANPLATESEAIIRFSSVPENLVYETFHKSPL